MDARNDTRPYRLPHGAKGIEGEGFALAFGEDKMVFVPTAVGDAGGPHKHYTLHAGPDSGVIDLHETTESADGQKHHHTVFAIRKDDLLPLIHQFGEVLPEFLGLLRPLRIGWMKHRHIGIARGVEPLATGTSPR
jgi:hypothetical protein